MAQYKPLQTAKIKTPWIHIKVWNKLLATQCFSTCILCSLKCHSCFTSHCTLSIQHQLGGLDVSFYKTQGLCPALPPSPSPPTHQYSLFFTIFCRKTVIKSTCTVQTGQVLLPNSSHYLPGQKSKESRHMLGWGCPTVRKETEMGRWVWFPDQ